MKVIDLLNKIANGEEVPKKIRIDHWCYKFEWVEHLDNYYDEDIDLMSVLSMSKEELNYGIEIIEEQKKIEPFTKEEMEIYHDMSAPIDDLVHKVSLVIDYINSKEDNNE